VGGKTGKFLIFLGFNSYIELISGVQDKKKKCSGWAFKKELYSENP
jgi:hypothetical protein